MQWTIHIRMSHWRYMMVDGAKFWINYQRLAFLSIFCCWQLIQNSERSNIVWCQCVIWIVDVPPQLKNFKKDQSCSYFSSSYYFFTYYFRFVNSTTWMALVLSIYKSPLLCYGRFGSHLCEKQERNVVKKYVLLKQRRTGKICANLLPQKSK